MPAATPWACTSSLTVSPLPSSAPSCQGTGGAWAVRSCIARAGCPRFRAISEGPWLSVFGTFSPSAPQRQAEPPCTEEGSEAYKVG